MRLRLETGEVVLETSRDAEVVQSALMQEFRRGLERAVEAVRNLRLDYHTTRRTDREQYIAAIEREKEKTK